MSTFNQIQTALVEIDQGRFQHLCDLYLSYKGYQNLNATGAVIGKDKVKRGTPDTYTRQGDGKVIFAEYTTQQGGVVKKIKDDLSKCLDQQKTGILISEIEEVVFCYNSQLSLEEANAIYDEAKKRGVRIRLFGITALSSDIYREYPGLAREFLGLNIDTGQILTPEEFVEIYDKNPLTTSLATDFHFRDKEINEILGNLENEKLVLISGPAGLGKTRIGLEAIKLFKQKHPDYEIKCILNLGEDLFNDLRTYFSKKGNYLILVDDANRISKFENIVHLLSNQKEGQNIRVIATVRDYALDKVRKAAQKAGTPLETSVNPFSESELSKLIKELFNINNDVWLKRIWDISKGNPRLAIMAARIAIKDDDLSSIRNVSDLYDQYFSNIREDLEKLSDSNLLKIAGIISFFRIVDKSNDIIMELIHKHFGIDQTAFWDGVNTLHEYELVDIYGDDVVKISDQVLSTYLFYLCAFKNKALDFKALLDNFFPDQINKIRDALYPCLRVFDADQMISVIRPLISELWTKYQEIKDEKSLRTLIETFWFVLKSETLAYIRNNISQMPHEIVALEDIVWKEAENGSNEILGLLAPFCQAEENLYIMAIELMYKYLEKSPLNVPDIIHFIIHEYGFDHRSYYNQYKYERILIDHMIQKTENGNNIICSKLFIRISSYFLRTKFESTESNKRSITINNFSLPPIPEVIKLRQSILEHLTKLYTIPKLQKDIIDALMKYCTSGYNTQDTGLIKEDAKLIIPFLHNNLSSARFSDCLLVDKYINFLKRRNLKEGTEIAEQFTTTQYQTYKVLSLDYADVHEEVKYPEFEKFKREKIKEHFKNYNEQDYKDLISTYLEISKFSTEADRSRYNLLDGINAAFIVIAENSPEMYLELIKYYLSLNDPLNLREDTITQNLVRIAGPIQALQIIEKSDFPKKEMWLFAYQQALSTDQIKPEDITRLYNLCREANVNNIPSNIFFWIQKYSSHAPEVIVRITKLLLKRAEIDANFGRHLSSLFYANKALQLKELFNNDVQTLKSVYFAYEKVERHADYDGAVLDAILNLDNGFLNEHINFLYSNKEYLSRYDDSRDYSFLWLRPDHKIIMESAIRQILDKEKSTVVLSTYLEKFFCVDEGRVPNSEIITLQDNFLREFITHNSTDTNLMQLIFIVISYFNTDRRQKLLAHFLSINKDFATFRNLTIEPPTKGWSGSAIPMHLERIEYLQSLIPLCNSIELIDHLRYMENLISRIQQAIEAERKSEFMDD